MGSPARFEGRTSMRWTCVGALLLGALVDGVGLVAVVSVGMVDGRELGGLVGWPLQSVCWLGWCGAGFVDWNVMAAKGTSVDGGSGVGGEGVPVVELFTDGACSGNPGPGGWAFVLRHPASGSVKELAGGEGLTTNNRMELMAVIRGLESLTRRSVVHLHSDSKYVLEGLRTWMADWKKRGWKTAAKKPVKNEDLWRRLDDLMKAHEVHFHWVRGHSGHPENERCDVLAVEAAAAAAAGGGGLGS